jgi:alkaline phosphatase D
LSALPDSNLFEHGVASGDPLTDRVMIWTQVRSDADSVPVTWTVARDADLSDVIVSGETTAEAEHDHTVHVDVTGLERGVTCHYGFTAEGQDSPVGRTWSLRSDAERLRFAMCSCAKHNAGFFNAYARIAERDDLDFLLHLGDYIYEAGNTPAKGQTPGADIGRDFDPLDECRTLEEYRTRYRQYHRDPDVQALHLAIPIIPTLDDHELADGAWAGGSDAHDPKVHGPWEDRKAAAFRARWEWLPARRPDPSDETRAFREIKVGDLADILLLDIRSRRDQPALEPTMSDPHRTMLGSAQRDWLMGALDESKAAWRLVGSPSIMHQTFSEGPSELLETAMLKLKLMDEDGEGPDEDQWDGYPVERDRVLAKFETIDDVVVLSADIHVCVASHLTRHGSTVAPEITAPSLTSQNLDEKLKLDPRDETIVASEKEFAEALDHVEWCEFSGHGYVVCDVDRERLRAEWWIVDGVLERLPGESMAAAYEVRRGSPELNAA